MGLSWWQWTMLGSGIYILLVLSMLAFAYCIGTLNKRFDTWVEAQLHPQSEGPQPVRSAA